MLITVAVDDYFKSFKRNNGQTEKNIFGLFQIYAKMTHAFSVKNELNCTFFNWNLVN